MLRLLKQDTGTATIELALLLPLLVFIFAITVDFGRVYYYSIAVTACARNGAVYASDPRIAEKSPYQNATEAALAEATDLNPQPTVTIGPPMPVGGLKCVTVTVTYPFRPVFLLPKIGDQLVIRRSVTMPENKLDIDPGV